MKPGTKLLSHEGHEWQVARDDRHNPGRVVIRTHKGDHFYAHKALIKHHAVKLTLFRRLMRWMFGVRK